MTVGSTLRERGMVVKRAFGRRILPPARRDPQGCFGAGVELLTKFQYRVGGARGWHVDAPGIGQSDERTRQRLELSAVAALEVARHGCLHGRWSRAQVEPRPRLR